MKTKLINQCLENAEYDIPYETSILLKDVAEYLKNTEPVVGRCATCLLKQPVYHNKMNKVVQYCFHWEKPTKPHNYCGFYEGR